MANRRAGTFLGQVADLVETAAGRGPPDRELLDRFVAARDEAAFAALVRRHGRTVLAVCRRVLRHEQDTEDAFQATFLVLAKKAGSVRKGEALASWLYGVAYRTAMAARKRNTRAQQRDRQAAVPVEA